MLETEEDETGYCVLQSVASLSWECCNHTVPREMVFEFLQLFIGYNAVISLTPNDPYRDRTAPLSCKVAFYIFIQQI